MASLFGNLFGKKSVSTAPEGKSVPANNNPGILLRGGSGAVYGYSAMSLQQIMRSYETIAPIYSAVSRIAEACSSLPIALVDKETRTPVPNAPAARLLNSPNNSFNPIRREYIRDWINWKILAGNIYALTTHRSDGTPMELYLPNPSEFTVYSDEYGYPYSLTRSYPVASYLSGSSSFQGAPTQGTFQSAAYTNQPEVQQTYTRDNRTGLFMSEDGTQSIYLVSNFNVRRSSTVNLGDSELSSLFYQINHFILSNNHNQSLLTNGARPSGAFVLRTKDGTVAELSEDAFARLQNQIDEQFSGTNNSGRPILLEGGLEFEPMQMSPIDLDFARLNEQAEDQIYSTLGVPVQLIKSTAATAGNMANIRLEFYEGRVLPLGDSFCDHLNNWLLPQFSQQAANRYEFTVLRDQIDVLIDQTVKRRKSIEDSTILTVNEKRQHYYKDEIDGGDKIVDPNGRPIAGPDADEIVGTTEEQITVTDAPEEGGSQEDAN